MIYIYTSNNDILYNAEVKSTEPITYNTRAEFERVKWTRRSKVIAYRRQFVAVTDEEVPGTVEVRAETFVRGAARERERTRVTLGSGGRRIMLMI